MAAPDIAALLAAYNAARKAADDAAYALHRAGRKDIHYHLAGGIAVGHEPENAEVLADLRAAHRQLARKAQQARKAYYAAKNFPVDSLPG